MIRWFGLLRGCAIAIVIAMGAAALFGCSGNNAPEGQPSFYQDLAGPAAALDAGAAQSMISGYRRNNGLGVVTIDPELMRLASEQATAMAARGALDHSIAAPFQQRIRKSQFDAAVAVVLQSREHAGDVLGDVRQGEGLTIVMSIPAARERQELFGLAGHWLAFPFRSVSTD